MSQYGDRHPGTQHAMQMLTPNDQLPPPGRDISNRFYNLADALVKALPDGPELTTGLRKLLEAKDCMVRQAVLSGDMREGWSALRA